jgi:serine protease Do
VRDYSSGTKEKAQVTGSGVVIRAEGYVVTNYHVAGEAEDVICTLWNKERVRAHLVGGDPLTDLAVLKLDYDEYKGAKPPVAEFGDSDRLHAGQIVMALGSPFALSRSLTFGVISTTDRYLSDDFRLPTGERTGLFNTWIQTDAAINPGNSGGPLVDLDGQVVGINSRAMMLANNLGFSIPSNVVRNVVADLIRDGRVERSWIGVEVQPLQELEEFFAADQGGVLISDVEPDSPAQQAGLRAGDLLLRIQGRPVSARFYEEIPAFYHAIAELDVGSQVTLDYQRGGAPQSVTVTTAAYGRPSGDNFEARAWGCAVRSITKQMALELRIDDSSGVLVTGVKGGAAGEEAGLLANDIVRSVDGAPVSTLDEFERIYASSVEKQRDRVMLTVQRRDSSRYVLLKVRFEEG